MGNVGYWCCSFSGDLHNVLFYLEISLFSVKLVFLLKWGIKCVLRKRCIVENQCNILYEP